MTIYTLTYSFSYLEPVCCSMSSSNCSFLTCIQVSQEAGQVVWYSHRFQNVPQFIVIHTVKGFGIVNKAEIDVFLELSCWYYPWPKPILLKREEKWRRKWQPTPVFLPRESQGRGSLVGCRLWGRTESEKRKKKKKRKRRKRLPQGRGGPSQERHWCKNVHVRVRFQDRDFM